VRVRKLINSPIGVRERWADKKRQAYASGLLSAPPSVDQIIKATRLPDHRGNHPEATQARGETKQPPAPEVDRSSGSDIDPSYTSYSMKLQSAVGDMARHERARVERVAGKFSFLSPRRIYFIQLTPTLVGGVQPPDAQIAASWVQSQRESPQVDQKNSLSTYLKPALDNPTDPVIIAVDLENRISAEGVRRWVAASKDLS